MKLLTIRKKNGSNVVVLLVLLTVLPLLSMLSVYFSSSNNIGRSLITTATTAAAASSSNRGASGDGDELSSLLKTTTRADSSSKTNHHQSTTIRKPNFHKVKLSVPEPVIVVGYPKSGTTTIWNYFNCSGVVAQHYCAKGDHLSINPPCQLGNNKNGQPTKTTTTMATCILRNMSKGKKKNANRTILDGCGDYQVYAQIDGERPILVRHRSNNNNLTTTTGSLSETGRINTQYKMRHFLPQHFYLMELHDAAPNATYILPLRSSSYDWAHSVYEWFRMKYYVYNEYRSMNSSSMAEGEYQPNNKTHTIQWLERIYNEHNHMVREFVKHHPSHLLVEVNISDENAGRMMTEIFFGGSSSSLSSKKNNNERCWGHYNKREEHDALMVTTAYKRRQRRRAASRRRRQQQLHQQQAVVPVQVSSQQ